jgi:hypothetical protein
MIDMCDRELERELALAENFQMHGIRGEGPLTRDQQDAEDRYNAYMEEQEREHELEMQNGGKTRCKNCDKFGMKHTAVSTGYDMSDFAKCVHCGHEEFAG